MAPPEPLWSIEQAAEWLGVPVPTMRRWRCVGYGPQALKIGRHVKYDPAEVRAWALAQRGVGA